MKTYKNLTPHEITRIDREERNRILAEKGASEEPLRLEEEEEFCEWTLFEGIRTPLYKSVHHFPEGDGPLKEDGLLYIVSYQVAVAFPGRGDLVVPKIVRNGDGEIMGCTGFCRPVKEL